MQHQAAMAAAAAVASASHGNAALLLALGHHTALARLLAQCPLGWAQQVDQGFGGQVCHKVAQQLRAGDGERATKSGRRSGGACQHWPLEPLPQATWSAMARTLWRAFRLDLRTFIEMTGSAEGHTAKCLAVSQPSL